MRQLVRFTLFLLLVAGLSGLTKAHAQVTWRELGPVTYSGMVRVAEEAGAPVFYHQRSDTYIQRQAAGAPAVRLPVPVSALVDVREDGSEILCYYDPNRGSWSGNGFPTASYLVNQQTGEWHQLPKIPGMPTYARFVPYGMSQDGTVIGRISSSDTLWSYSRAAGYRQLDDHHSYNEAPLSVNRDLSRMVRDQDWWTPTAGWIKLPTTATSVISRISANGEWIVATGTRPTWKHSESLMRLQVTPEGTLGTPVPLHVPLGWRIHSIARVLDDGRVIATLSTESSNAYRFMDAFIWHANGRMESLTAAVRRAFGEDALPEQLRLGKVMSVSSDGRYFAGARELLYEGSVNDSAVAWSLSLDEAIPSLPSVPVMQLLQVDSTLDVTLCNMGGAPLVVSAAAFEGAEASRFSFSYNYKAGPFQPVTLAPGENVRLSFIVNDGNLDRSALLRLTSNDPRAEAGEIELRHKSMMMPDIRVQRSSSVSVYETAVDRIIEIPFWVLCVSDYRNVTVTGLSVSVDGGDADLCEIVPEESFDLARGTSRKIMLRARFHEAGAHEVRASVSGPPECRLPQPLLIPIQVRPQATLQWVAEDGVTVLDPDTDVIDAGQVTINSAIYMPVRLRNPGTEPVTLISRSGTSANDPFLGPFDTIVGAAPPLPVIETLTAVPAGQTVTKYLRVVPKTVGEHEGSVTLDSQGLLLAPITLKAHCTAVDAGPGVFLDQPPSVIITHPVSQPLIRVLGSGPMTAQRVSWVGEQASGLGSELSIDTQSCISYVASPGAWKLRLHNSRGTTLSQTFYVVQIPNSVPSQHSLRVGEKFEISVSAIGPGVTFQWKRDGQVLTDTNGYKGTQTSALTVTSIKELHAGEYACDLTVTAPDRTLTKQVTVASLLVNDPSLTPSVVPFSLRRAREGEFMSFSIGAQGRMGKMTITGLPPGLRQMEAGGQLVQGFIGMGAASTKVATYKVRVVVRSGAVTGPVYEVPWEIEPYQDDGLAGTYHGLIEQPNTLIRGRFTVSMTTAGTGSFSWEGNEMLKTSGRVILVGRGPESVPASFDPPLALGMLPPLPGHGILCVGKLRMDASEPDYLELTQVRNIMVGGLSSPAGSGAASGFRLTKPVAGLIPGNKAAVYSQVLEHQAVEGKVWRQLPVELPQDGGPGLLVDAITFLDQRERLHLFGSKSNTVYDHWMWDPQGRKWMDARAALGIPENDPTPPREPEMVVWRSTTGGDCWLLTKQGGLWRWSAVTARWQMVQPPLPNGSTGEAGVLGVPSPQNRPRPRNNATTWLHPDGSLWMFGGFGCVDLWRFDPAISQWTWMAGRTVLSSEEADWRSDGVLQPTSQAEFAPTWVDKNGRLWMMEQTSMRQQLMWVFDPVTRAWSQPYAQSGNDPVPGKRSKDALCWTDDDGNLMLFGGFDSGIGYYNYPQYPDGHVWSFNLQSNAWRRLELTESAELQGGVWGFVRSQVWRTSSGRVHLRGGIQSFSGVYVGNSFGPFVEFDDPHLPKVPGFMASTLAASGTLTWSGRLPDGELFTGASAISKIEIALPYFEIDAGSWLAPNYSVLSHRKSSLLGLLTFNPGDESCGSFLTWSRPQSASIASQRLLPLGFTWIGLLGQGWRYDPAVWSQNLPAEPLPLDQLAGLPATDLLLSFLSKRFTATLSPWSPSSVTTTFVPATGFFSLKGKIGTQPKTSREFQLHGLLLPKARAAAGHFTVPREVDPQVIPRQTSTTTEIQIGGF